MNYKNGIYFLYALGLFSLTCLKQLRMVKLFSLKFVLILFYIAGIFSCGGNGKTVSTYKNKLKPLIEGNWISDNFLDSLNYYWSPSRVRNTPCFEMIISSKMDSVAWIDVGEEMKTFPVKVLSDSSFSIEELNLVGTYSNNYKTLFLKKSGLEIKLKKLPQKYAVKSLRGWMSGIVLFLNEELIADEYFLVDEVTGKNIPCYFTAYGEVHGISTYEKYKLCFAGDCLLQSDDDVITLTDEKSSDRYIWKWEGDTLRFYSVMNTGTLKDPFLVQHDLMFSFIRKRN